MTIRTAILLPILAVATAAAAQSVPEGPLVGQATMIDGDTIQLAGQRVRLYGVDAFEADQRCPIPGGGERRCGANASHRLAELIGAGPVICVRRDIDAYGRIVAVCRVGSTDLGAALVREGHAVAFRRYASDYVPDEDAARLARVGAWASGFVAPEDYRAGGNRDIATAQRAVTAGSGCDIRGNINRQGERIYHMPSDPYYARTTPEATFCSEDEARAAGFRRAGQPGANAPARVTPAPARVMSRPAPSPRPAASRYYANCAAARAAGAAPVRRGQPGYGRHLDRDGDGVGCER